MRTTKDFPLIICVIPLLLWYIRSFVGTEIATLKDGNSLLKTEVDAMKAELLAMKNHIASFEVVPTTRFSDGSEVSLLQTNFKVESQHSRLDDAHVQQSGYVAESEARSMPSNTQTQILEAKLSAAPVFDEVSQLQMQTGVKKANDSAAEKRNYNVANGLYKTSNAAFSAAYDAGKINQGMGATAIGLEAGKDNQGMKAVAMGVWAGQEQQQQSAVAVGLSAGQFQEGEDAVAIGMGSGMRAQGADAVSIGGNAGNRNQQTDAVALGMRAGETNQGERAIAIGAGAGLQGQAEEAVAVGYTAGYKKQGAQGVAMGNLAGYLNQGAGAVAIGAQAGYDSQGEGGIIINGAPSKANNVVEGHIVLRTKKASLVFEGGDNGQWSAQPKLGSGAVDFSGIISRLDTLESLLKRSYSVEKTNQGEDGYCVPFARNDLCKDSQAELAATCDGVDALGFLTNCDRTCAENRCSLDSACKGFSENNGRFKLKSEIIDVKTPQQGNWLCHRKTK